MGRRLASARAPILVPVLAPILALLLSACGDTPVAEALRGVLPSAEAPAPPSPGGPGLRLAGPRQSIVFTLAQQTGNRRLWRADGGIAVATEGPRITATAGLGQMLTATRQEGPDPLDDVLALLGNPGGNPGSTRRTVDLAGASREPSTMRFGLVIECRLTASRRLGEILVREECTSPAGPFVNRFWADPETGAVLRSEQWVGNEAPAVTMEMR